jgi:ribonucleotide monophosphatase NagD (HAD superfamily)
VRAHAVNAPTLERLVRPAAVLLDLDGVLYVEDEPIPGAIEAVALRRARGLRLRFVTNTTRGPGATSSRVSSGSGCPSRKPSS